MANFLNVRIADSGQTAIAILKQHGISAIILIKEAVLKSGMTIVLEAKRRCPVDTGRLRASIGMWDAANLRTGNVEASPEDAIWELTDRGLNLRLGTNVSYAWDVETKPAQHITGQMGFMKAGVDASMGRIVKYFEDALRKACSLGGGGLSGGGNTGLPGMNDTPAIESSSWNVDLQGPQ